MAIEESSSGLANFLRNIAAEKRASDKTDLLPYVGFTLAETIPYDWKADDGRVAFVKDGKHMLAKTDGLDKDVALASGRRQARRLDFVYTGHYAVPRAGAVHEWGGLSRSDMVKRR
mmetsp:Transcript_56848/g.176878  ORF Transcript_56848/g.176878 Transcript_56848/m.176878 type:complete len:116 (+) Transcript_56848:37-384(+)